MYEAMHGGQQTTLDELVSEMIIYDEKLAKNEILLKTNHEF